MTQTTLKVFLSDTSKDVTFHRDFLNRVLEKAEMEVFCLNEAQRSDENGIQKHIQNTLKSVDSSIHIIGNDYEKFGSSEHSITEIQLIEAKNISQAENSDFRVFIWQPLQANDVFTDINQEKFITSIRNSILQNITISNDESSVSFVEDMYSIMSSQKKDTQKGEDTQVFFIHNELDQESATGITELLSDILKIQTLSMIQNVERDYSDFIKKQSKQSKLVVVYFKWSTNWVIPFVQQLWRLLGGASSKVPIIVIADSDFEEQYKESFNLPNINTYFVSQDLIPLEIKVQYDKFINE